MTDFNTDTSPDQSADNGDQELRADVLSTGGASKAPSYDIAPEDQHYADRLAQLDLIATAPPANSYPENWQPKVDLTLSALSPALRAEAAAQLSAIPANLQASKERDVVAAVLHKNRTAIRVMAGIHADALPLHQEIMQLEYDHRDLERQFDSISAALSDIIGHRTERDPETGSMQAVPVYRVEGARRAAYVSQQEALLRNMRELHNEDGTPGPGAQPRLKKARWETVQRLKSIAEQVEDQAAAERMSSEMVREQRIKNIAETRARMKRTEV